jgi:methionyl-tRNA formyltransferase
MKIEIIYAGDRDLSVKTLQFIIEQGIKPIALILPNNGSHGEELIKLCPFLDESRIFKVKTMKDEKLTAFLKSIEIDYVFGIHFPLIIPKDVLEIPKVGFLNLHPAYLPFNRGWHTPSWAILDQTPYGATLHFMSEQLDAGDIIHQKRTEILIDDTADILYKRVKETEFEVFKEAWPRLLEKNINKVAQDMNSGTKHSKKDLAEQQEIELNGNYTFEELLRKLRALTTNDIKEAAYFKLAGSKYHIQVKIEKEN